MELEIKRGEKIPKRKEIQPIKIHYHNEMVKNIWNKKI